MTDTQPESEIGPVANYLLGDAHKRIEADRAIIAALRAEVAALHNERTGLIQTKREQLSRLTDRAEAAEARVKELGEQLANAHELAASARDTRTAKNTPPAP